MQHDGKQDSMKDDNNGAYCDLREILLSRKYYKSYSHKISGISTNVIGMEMLQNFFERYLV